MWVFYIHTGNRKSKRATSLTPKKGYQFGLHFGSFAVIKMRITFPKNTPSNRSSPVVRQNIFMGFYAFVVFFFSVFGWRRFINSLVACPLPYSGSPFQTELFRHILLHVTHRLAFACASLLDLQNFWIFLQSFDGFFSFLVWFLCMLYLIFCIFFWLCNFCGGIFWGILFIFRVFRVQ